MTDENPINKDSLEKSIGFIGEIDLNEDDLEKIFKDFSPLLDNPQIKKKLEDLSGIDSSTDLQTITKAILNKLDEKDLNFLMEKLIKNENLTNSIQDLILEKLI